AAVDHRHHDAVGAVVEDALDVIVAIGGHARQGHAASVGDGGEDVRGGLPVAQAVFDIDGQPVEAAAGHEARGGNAAEGEPGAQGGLTSFEGVFDAIGTHAISSRKNTSQTSVTANCSRKPRNSLAFFESCRLSHSHRDWSASPPRSWSPARVR